MFRTLGLCPESHLNKETIISASNGSKASEIIFEILAKRCFCLHKDIWRPWYATAISLRAFIWKQIPVSSIWVKIQYCAHNSNCPLICFRNIFKCLIFRVYRILNIDHLILLLLLWFAFYPRKSRQRCTLRHVMPLHNVHNVSPFV